MRLSHVMRIDSDVAKRRASYLTLSIRKVTIFHIPNIHLNSAVYPVIHLVTVMYLVEDYDPRLQNTMLSNTKNLKRKTHTRTHIYICVYMFQNFVVIKYLYILSENSEKTVLEILIDLNTCIK